MVYELKKPDNENFIDKIKIGPILTNSFEIKVAPGTIAIIENNKYKSGKNQIVLVKDCSPDDHNMVTIYLINTNHNLTFNIPITVKTINDPAKFLCEILPSVELYYSVILNLKCTIWNYITFSQYFKCSVSDKGEISKLYEIFWNAVSTDIKSAFKNVTLKYMDGKYKLSEASYHEKEWLQALKDVIQPDWEQRFGIGLEDLSVGYNITPDSSKQKEKIYENINNNVIDTLLENKQDKKC